MARPSPAGQGGLHKERGGEHRYDVGRHQQQQGEGSIASGLRHQRLPLRQRGGPDCEDSQPCIEITQSSRGLQPLANIVVCGDHHHMCTYGMLVADAGEERTGQGRGAHQQRTLAG